MKCSGCGYLSFDALEACKRCGAPMLAETRSAAASGRDAASAPDPAFRVDDDLFAGGCPDRENSPPQGAAPTFSPDPDADVEPPALTEDPVITGREFALEGWGAGTGVVVSPIVDQEDDVPDQFWAPEIIGLGRRAVALLVDLALLAGLLGVFFFGAAAALRLSGFDTDLFFAPAGLQAALFPFALLAALLSLVYNVYFHGRTGQTPGKALAGVEIRTGEGSVPSCGRAALRWLAAALGLVCAGAGVLWALFEPRHRGWADLLSKTTLAERRREEP